MVGVGAVWSLAFALLAVHAGYQHKLVELWGFIYAALIGLAIPLLGLKWPTAIYQNRDPETYAEAAALMPRWTQRPVVQRITFWAWLIWAFFLTAGAAASGVREQWVAFAALLWAAVWCWVRFAYAVKRKLPPPGLPPSFP
jgi:hypothetical protein